MNRIPTRLACVIATLLLSACAGPAPKSAPKPAPVAAPKPPAPAQRIVGGYELHPVYLITFDAAGVARSANGQSVTKDRVLDLLARNAIDRKTVIHIEVPKGITDRDQSIQAFSRAQQVAKIFDLLGFESVLVALAK